MASKKTEENGKGDELLPNQVLIAGGTELERKHTVKILRGKKYRNLHLKLLETFGELEGVARGVDGQNAGLKGIIDTIQAMFNKEGLNFEDEMLPFALGMETDEEREYLEKLIPLEQFMAYMSAASFIVNGAQAPDVQAALKK